MSNSWKTFRVFISSTFQDMNAERDHLVKVVFQSVTLECGDLSPLSDAVTCRALTFKAPTSRPAPNCGRSTRNAETPHDLPRSRSEIHSTPAQFIRRTFR